MSFAPRTLCVLRADIAERALAYERLGQTEALYAIDRCVKRVERAVETHGGRVVKSVAGEVVSVMPDPDAAMQAALEMLQRVDDLPPSSGVKLGVRVGFHSGPGTENGRDIIGEASDIAGRLSSAARAGQILTSGPTVAQLSAHQRRAARPIDESLIGSAGIGVPVAELVWQENASPVVTAPIGRRRPLAGRLLLRHGGAEILLGDKRDAATLGRDTTNDVVVMDKRASRNHARIERRRDKFMLVDLSTNGTFVTFEGELEIALKHEEVALRGRGTISFGHSHQDARVETAEFEVQA